ncbi:MAG: 16S rRNA (cytidine(1402)-2'-O)-methyltransferase [Actinomycetota bacterium]
MPGRLILCATPIGNLEDMSPRAVRTLEEASVLACEDTRRTRKLLSHFGISARRLVVYNEGNERRKAEELVRVVERGQTLVLVSDAGMPGLSDPGYRLVTACVERGFTVEVIPGPNAAVTALALAGIAPGRFVFEGFLPRKRSERRRHIEGLRDEQRTIVIYESPHRIEACLADLAPLLGERRAVLARELTKLHEEVRRGTLDELLVQVREDPPRGEIVVVVEGATGGHRAPPGPSELADEAERLMGEGIKRSEAMARVAKERGVAKREVFDALLERKHSAEQSDGTEPGR